MDSIARAALTRTYPHHRWRHVATNRTRLWALEGAPALYVNIARISDSLEPGLSPMAEADRTRWLSAQGVPCPEVVDAGLIDDEEYLVTGAVPGRPLPEFASDADYIDIVDEVARTVSRLHRIPLDECPFDRRLRVTIPMAQEAAGLGEVDLAGFGGRAMTTTTLVTELLAKARLVGREEPVVCHGNLSADNILIDPDTRRVAALLGAARCGVADRYVDLAKTTAGLNEVFDRDAAKRFIYRYGENPVDPERLDFYRLLDRFW
ncbi:MAG TPA: phosphotransferase [Candidatus Stackebrandtia excrementipullorum]|nr:phosphotransferase [Candidatus Stackebrandtia excrementipullorum]